MFVAGVAAGIVPAFVTTFTWWCWVVMACGAILVVHPLLVWYEHYGFDPDNPTDWRS